MVAQAQVLKSVSKLLKAPIGSPKVMLAAKAVVFYHLRRQTKWQEKRTKSRTRPVYVTAELACSRYGRLNGRR